MGSQAKELEQSAHPAALTFKRVLKVPCGAGRVSMLGVLRRQLGQWEVGGSVRLWAQLFGAAVLN